MIRWLRQDAIERRIDASRSAGPEPEAPSGPWWLAPQVLVAGLVAIAALVFALGGPERPAPPPSVSVEPSTPARAPLREVELVTIDADGLERTIFVEIAVPEATAERFAAIFGALRDVLAEADAWPESVPAPRAFVPRLAGRDTVVLDVAVPPGVAIDVASEARAVASLEATADRHGVALRFLVDGQPARTLFGHVAVPSALQD